MARDGSPLVNATSFSSNLGAHQLPFVDSQNKHLEKLLFTYRLHHANHVHRISLSFVDTPRTYPLLGRTVQSHDLFVQQIIVFVAPRLPRSKVLLVLLSSILCGVLHVEYVFFDSVHQLCVTKDFSVYAMISPL